MVNANQKGSRAEDAVKKFLIQHTGLGWERVPGSGALAAKHMLKGDLYIPGKNTRYCVEVKHYAEDQIRSKLLTSESPEFITWWSQACRQAAQVNKHPLLIFKYDRSKLFVAFNDMIPEGRYRHLTFCEDSGLYCTICLLTDFLKFQNPRFIDE